MQYTKNSFISELVYPYIIRIKNNDTLNKIQAGGLANVVWRTFAIERYQAAHSFIPLLKKAILDAQKLGDLKLVEILNDNLSDELGINNPEHGSHEIWRINFYSALGVQPEDLQIRSVLQATHNYEKVMSDLINSSDVYSAIGAITVLEATIPYEFFKILQGCEKDFPEKFLIGENESEFVLNEKRKDRLYLEDHIVHDMNGHFADLHNSLTVYADNVLARNGLTNGMHQVMNAKFKFLNQLGNLF